MSGWRRIFEIPSSPEKSIDEAEPGEAVSFVRTHRWCALAPRAHGYRVEMNTRARFR